MALDEILHEVEQLQNISTRLSQLSDRLPSVTVQLLAIAESIRNSAVLLAVLAATKTPKPI